MTHADHYLVSAMSTTETVVDPDQWAKDTLRIYSLSFSLIFVLGVLALFLAVKFDPKKTRSFEVPISSLGLYWALSVAESLFYGFLFGYELSLIPCWFDSCSKYVVVPAVLAIVGWAVGTILLITFKAVPVFRGISIGLFAYRPTDVQRLPVRRTNEQALRALQPAARYDVVQQPKSAFLSTPR